MEELIGSQLARRYQIESLLGRQTGRRTMLAIDIQTHNPVVIKLLLFGPDFTWDDLKLFEREAEVLKSLDHPAIPKYLDFFEVELEWGKGFALVQSHLAAQSLQQWIQAGRTFSEKDLKVIAKNLLEILEYLHARQPAVIHRDVKPSNVLLTDRTAHNPGQVYLVDFGSVQTAVKGDTRTIVGTYGYMPPEQFGGITSPASDLYALGATLIYLATGCHPDELPQQDLRLRFEDRVNLNPGFVRWLQQAIAPSLDKRWSSASQALLKLNVGDNFPAADDQSSNAITYQPFGSRVKLKKTSQYLEILLPSGRFHPVMIPLMGLAVWLITWMYFSGIAALSPLFQGGIVKSEFAFAGFVYLGLGLSCLLLIIIAWLKYLHRTRLYLNRSTISLSHELTNTLRWTVQKAQIENIIKLELSLFSFKKDSQGDNIVKLPQINIWVGTQQISLGGFGRLTLPELEWLSAELSNWLGIPVDKTFVTEDRPPVNSVWRSHQ
jgi:serine/threonine protein kinase